ncbi:methionyl-tRNA formyltransferase, partial [Adlercreutzia equolifaciens]
MRVVFMGTPRFAAEILDELAEFHEIAAVYTRPDAVRGRGKALVPSPVKEVAERRGFPVRTPRTLRDAAVLSELAAFAPDVICVAAYGAILPKEVLDLPPFGCLNVHGSLLPRWRGAAPIERAILAGDEEIGVCIMAMEEGLDTGDYCVCRSLPAGSRTAAELTEELAALGASALLTALAQAEGGNLRWVAQDEALVTYAEKIAKGELNLDPAESAVANDRRVRASGAAHPARAVVAGRPLTVLAA